MNTTIIKLLLGKYSKTQIIELISIRLKILYDLNKNQFVKDIKLCKYSLSLYWFNKLFKSLSKKGLKL